jgi:hypothetical protein
MTAPQPAPLDTGNQLLAETPATLTTALVETPKGQRLALTIRTASATLTVFLGRADGETWARNIKGTAGQMSSAGLIVANGIAPKGEG